jgi:hypothetical protein
MPTGILRIEFTHNVAEDLQLKEKSGFDTF